MNVIRTLGVAAMVAAGAAGAEAKTVTIDGLGGPISLNSKDLSSFVFGAGNTPPTFTNSVLAAIHADINADGVATEDKTTVILAETSYGLSLIVLVDREDPSASFASLDSTVGMTSTVGRNSMPGPDMWINDSGGDLTTTVVTSLQQTAIGEFNWDSASGRGDAFAWSSLRNGDFMSFNFQKGPSDPFSADPFQFVSWDGSSWVVVDTADFSSGDQFAFNATVIPLPTPVMLATAGLIVLAGVRRRV